MATNLEFITNVNGNSNVTSFDVTDVFTARYDVYKVVTTITTDTAFKEVPMRLLDTSGVNVGGSDYDNAFLELRASTTFGEGRVTGDTEIIRPMRTGSGSASAGNNVIYFYNPFDSSKFTFLQYQVSAWASDTPQGVGQKGISVHKVAESIGGFRYFVSSGNITSHSVSVFGVK
jgi:hypothetical protein